MADTNDLASIYSDIKEGNEEQAKDKVSKLLCRNVPYRNLFYVVPALRKLDINYSQKKEKT